MKEITEQNPEIIPLVSDVVLKMYFEDSGNRPQLRQFLKATLNLADDDLLDIAVLNSELLRDQADDKGLTIDLLLKSKSGDFIHLEMQRKIHNFFKSRTQIYNARIAGGQLKIGEDYCKVKRAISLIITEEKMFDDGDEYHEKIMMRRENGQIFTDMQEINILDLSKVNKEKFELDPKYLWARLLKVTTKEELNLIAEASEEMEQAAEKLKDLSKNEKAWARKISRENAEFAQRLHEQGVRDEGKEEGRIEGKEEGRIEGKEEGRIEGKEEGRIEGKEEGRIEGKEEGRDERDLEIAKSMLADDLPLMTISKHTNLSVEELEELKKNN